MKRLLKKFENTMAAVVFGEAGEVETAKEILCEEKPLPEKIEEIKHRVDLMIDDLIAMAIAFAEEGEFGIALGIMKEVKSGVDIITRRGVGFVGAMKEVEDSVDKLKRIYQKILEHRVLVPKMNPNYGKCLCRSGGWIKSL